MKDAVISAATLAGLVGLACLYGNGAINHRARREVVSVDELGENNTLEGDIEGNAEWEFINSLGYFEDDADVPVEFVEDVQVFAKASAQKKGVGFIKKCLNSGNTKCKDQAIKTVNSWGTTNQAYMNNNYDVLMKPVISKIVDDPDNIEVGACAPDKEDGGLVLPCADESLNVDFSALNPVDPSKEYSNRDVYVQHYEQLRDESTAFKELTDFSLIPEVVTARTNVFEEANTKFFFIQPNGIPVTMADDYEEHWANYWGFMQSFNDKFLGIQKDTSVKGRQNMHFWFIRQDKQPRYMMKAPAKATKRFPWNRFKNLMTTAQSTAIQPKLLGTYRDVLRQVENRNMGSTYPTGQDCIILWFHQYIPGDILALSDSMGQETISGLEKNCNIIHYWVGFNHADSYKVVAYLQGILQPGQKSKTSFEPTLRDYYFIKDLKLLAPGSEFQTNLLHSTYNSIALDRKRCKCFFQTPSVDVAGLIDTFLTSSFPADEGERQDDFYPNGATDTPPGAIYEQNMLDLDPSLYDEVEYLDKAPEIVNTVTGNVAPVLEAPDYSCCGIGLGADKYDIHRQECCEDGSIKSFDDQGSSTCP